MRVTYSKLRLLSTECSTYTSCVYVRWSCMHCALSSSTSFVNSKHISSYLCVLYLFGRLCVSFNIYYRSTLSISNTCINSNNNRTSHWLNLSPFIHRSSPYTLRTRPILSSKHILIYTHTLTSTLTYAHHTVNALTIHSKWIHI